MVADEWERRQRGGCGGGCGCDCGIRRGGAEQAREASFVRRRSFEGGSRKGCVAVEVARLQPAAMEGTMLRCGRPIHLTCVMVLKPDERDQVAHAISRRPKFHGLWPERTPIANVRVLADNHSCEAADVKWSSAHIAGPRTIYELSGSSKHLTGSLS